MYIFLWWFFMVKNFYKLLKIGTQENGWYFFDWDLKVLSQSAAKHTTYTDKITDNENLDIIRLHAFMD